MYKFGVSIYVYIWRNAKKLFNMEKTLCDFAFVFVLLEYKPVA
jgi:hypothetical protein